MSDRLNLIKILKYLEKQKQISIARDQDPYYPYYWNLTQLNSWIKEYQHRLEVLSRP